MKDFHKFGSKSSSYSHYQGILNDVRNRRSSSRKHLSTEEVEKLKKEREYDSWAPPLFILSVALLIFQLALKEYV